MRAHLKYASYVARHKWFVFRAGLKTKAPLWRLLIHDWSKFSAGRAITGKWEVAKWYDANVHKMVLHPEVREMVDALVDGQR